MKIIQVCPTYLPDIGGIATHVKELSEMLVKMGHDVEVVCTDPSQKLPKNEVINGVRVSRFWAFAPGEAYYFSPGMYFYLRSTECDVIHAHNYHSFQALFAALAGKKKFIFTPHTFGFSRSLFRNFLHKLYRPIGSYIFDSADTVISTAQFERNWLSQTFRISDSKLIYIPLPINPARTIVNRQTSGVKRIGYFGRLSIEKNLKVLISAFKLLRTKKSDIELFIAGDGPIRNELEESAKGIEGVAFLGRLPQSELESFIQTLDIFVLPSIFEVSPRAVIEAMSRNIPVVTTPVGELPQVFEHGKHCMFIKIDDPVDTAEKIMLLMEDRQLAEKIAQAGRVLVEERYDIKKVILEYLRIYGAISSSREHMPRAHRS
ncbi:MAG: glycosyltransferase family 4 protein [Candidatus Methanoperedens sp.]|nr:glycosyltransferase family 4 protein [Candidatus Methanoperedens sp.]